MSGDIELKELALPLDPVGPETQPFPSPRLIVIICKLATISNLQETHEDLIT